MTSPHAKVNKSSGAHFQTLFLKFCYFLTFLNIQINLIIKTYDQQFTLTTKRSIDHCIPPLISDKNRDVPDILSLFTIGLQKLENETG